MAGTATYVSNMDYDEFGQVAATYLNTGNIVSQPCYNATNRRIVALRTYTGGLQSCTVANPTNSKLNLKYTYFNNGNVQQIVDQTRSETLNYTYDDLDRLLSATGPYTQSFGYNAIGNLTLKAGVTLNYTAQSAACPNGALSKPHAATSAGSDTYCYDQSGNMVKRVEGGATYTQNFDAENRLTSVIVNGQTTQYIYDGDGKRAKEIAPDGSYTIYLNDIYDVKYNASNVKIGETLTYYAGSQRVAMRENGTLTYLLGDNLGSSTAVLNTTGSIVNEERYFPFGELRDGAWSLNTNFGYTGQRRLIVAPNVKTQKWLGVRCVFLS